MSIKNSIWCKVISLTVIFSFLITNCSQASLTDALNPPKTGSRDIAQIEPDLSLTPQFQITDPEKIVITENVGKVKEIFKGNDGRLVINIQDAHCNFEAQTNISQILGILVKNGLRIVALEGSTGEIDPSLFTTFPDEEIRKEVAAYFMKKGKINGAEYLAITSKNPPQLYGVETKEYYLANLSTFLNTLEGRKKVKAACIGMKNILEKLKTHIYSKELKELDAMAIANKEGKVDFLDYCNYLKEVIDARKLPLERFPNSQLLYETINIEKTLNFSKVESERSKVITLLEGTLSQKELEELFSKSLSFKSGRINAAMYHIYLRRLAGEKAIDFNKYPNLNLYANYLLIYENIDSFNLLKEIFALEDAAKQRLFNNADQRTLDKLSNNIRLLEKMLDISMSKEDVEYYQKNKELFRSQVFITFIKEKAKRYKISSDYDPNFELVDKYLPDLENFYRIANTRDDAIIENTLNRMEEEKANVVALITGGYHTEGISERLRNRGISYIVISPRITKPDNDNPYLEILRGEKIPEGINLKTGNTQLAISSALEKRDGIGATDRRKAAVNFAEQFARVIVEKLRRHPLNEPQLIQALRNAFSAWEFAYRTESPDPDIDLKNVIEEAIAKVFPEALEQRSNFAAGVVSPKVAKIAQLVGVSQLLPEHMIALGEEVGHCGVWCLVGPSQNQGGLPAKQVLVDGIQNSQHRGYQSCAGKFFGKDGQGNAFASRKVAVLGGSAALANALTVSDQTAEDATFNERLGSAVIRMGHARWPTRGKATPENQHPISVGGVSIVFNGDVTNYVQIDAILEREAEERNDINLKRPEGIETDAWTISAYIYFFYTHFTEGKTEDDMLQAINMAYNGHAGYPSMDGYFAVIAANENFPESAFGFVKSTPPLYVGLGENKDGAKIGNIIASETGAIVSYNRFAIKVKENDIVHVTPLDVTVYRSKKITPETGGEGHIELSAHAKVRCSDVTTAINTKKLPAISGGKDYKVEQLDPAEYFYAKEPGYDYFFRQEIEFQDRALAGTVHGYSPPSLYPDKLPSELTPDEVVNSIRFRDALYNILIEKQRVPNNEEVAEIYHQVTGFATVPEEVLTPSAYEPRIDVLRTWIHEPERAARSNVLFPGLTQSVSLDYLRGIENVLIIASGTSGHAGKAMKSCISTKAAVNVDVKDGTAEYMDTRDRELRVINRELLARGVNLAEFVPRDKFAKHFNPDGSFKKTAEVEDLVAFIEALKLIINDKRYRDIPELENFRRLLDISKKTLGIAVTQSGGTKDSINGMLIAKTLGMRFLGIINKPGVTDIGDLTENDLGIFHTYAKNERAVASTKAHPSQEVALSEFALYLGLVRGTISKKPADRFLNQLLAVPKHAREILRRLDSRKDDNWAARMGKRLCGATAIPYFGRGGDDTGLALALEGALKMKEQTYKAADGLNLAAMKHGPIAWFNPSGDPLTRNECVVVSIDDAKEEQILKNLDEIVGRSGMPICVVLEKHAKAFLNVLTRNRSGLMPVIKTHIQYLNECLQILRQHGQWNLETLIQELQSGEVKLTEIPPQKLDEILITLRELVETNRRLDLHIAALQRDLEQLTRASESLFTIPDVDEDIAPILAVIPLQMVTLRTTLAMDEVSKQVGDLAEKLYSVLLEYQNYDTVGHEQTAALDNKLSMVMQEVDYTWNELLASRNLDIIEPAVLRTVRIAMADMQNATKGKDRLERGRRLMKVLSTKQVKRVSFFQDQIETQMAVATAWDREQLELARGAIKEAEAKAKAEVNALTGLPEELQAAYTKIFLRECSNKLEPVVAAITMRQQNIAVMRKKGVAAEQSILVLPYNEYMGQQGIAENLERNPDMPRNLAKIVTVEDRLPQHMIDELKRLGLSEHTIELMSRSVMKLDTDGKVHSYRSVIQLLADLRRVPAKVVLRESLFHERIHNLFRGVDPVNRQRIIRAITQGISRVEQQQYELGDRTFSEQFRDMFGEFDDFALLVEESIAKYYQAKYTGDKEVLALFAGSDKKPGVGALIEKCCQALKFEYTDADLLKLAGILRKRISKPQMTLITQEAMAADPAGIGELRAKIEKASQLDIPEEGPARTAFLSELRKQMPKNLDKTFNIDFHPQLDVGGRQRNITRSAQLDKLFHITMLARLGGADVRIYSDPECADIGEQVRITQIALARERNPVINQKFDAAELERLDALARQLDKQGVVIMGGFYIGPDVDVRNFRNGRIMPGTIITGRTKIDEGCVLSGTIEGNSRIGRFCVIQNDGKTISNSSIGSFSVIMDCGISDYDVGNNADLSGVDFSMTGESSFGNGTVITMAPEQAVGKGRKIPICANMSLQEAKEVSGDIGNAELQEKHRQRVAASTIKFKSKRGHIGEYATIKGSSPVQDTWIGNYAVLNSPGPINDSTIMSDKNEPTYIDGTATQIQHSIVQWGCHIGTGAKLNRVMVFEHTKVENDYKATDMVIGPNSEFGQGEGTASFVGEFSVGHHSSMLIGAYAPGGKMNVGQDVSAGSNHPGTSPLHWAVFPEGMFFGLACKIGYPINMENAPYTVIASGVETLPQRYEFPMSVISGKPPKSMISETVEKRHLAEPGAVNPYMLIRNEEKWQDRNKANPDRCPLDVEVFGPANIDKIIDANKRLKTPKAPPISYMVDIKGIQTEIPIYTKVEMEGIGENFMTESVRLLGIERYTNMIRRYALRGLNRELEKFRARKVIDWGEILQGLLSNSDPRWLHERKVLLSEMGIDISQMTAEECTKFLIELGELEINWYNAVVDSRSKDWNIGKQVHEDFDEIQGPIGQDKFLANLQKQTTETTTMISRLVDEIKTANPNPPTAVSADAAANEDAAQAALQGI